MHYESTEFEDVSDAADLRSLKELIRNTSNLSWDCVLAWGGSP